MTIYLVVLIAFLSQVGFGGSRVAVSLHALGECLRNAFPALRQVMAMDGGSSSDVAISPSLRQATSKTAGFHTWISLLESSTTTHVGLPAVIGISPRREQAGSKTVDR